VKDRPGTNQQSSFLTSNQAIRFEDIGDQTRLPASNLDIITDLPATYKPYYMPFD